MHSMGLPSDGTAHHHGDFSGDVIFVVSKDAVEGLSDLVEVKIPFEDIEKVVLEKYRRGTISELEQMDTEQLVKLFGRAW